MLAPSHHQLVSNLIESEMTIGDQIRFSVISNSMQPILQIGDSVVAEVIPDTDVKPGDIIVIKRVDDFLTHRVISKSKDGWLTKGDNNVRLDPPVPKENFIGRVRIVQKTNQLFVFETSRWRRANKLLARLGELETRAFFRHRFLRLPFRICSKGVQKLSTLDLR